MKNPDKKSAAGTARNASPEQPFCPDCLRKLAIVALVAAVGGYLFARFVRK